MKQSVIKEMVTNELEDLLDSEKARLEKIARIKTELRTRELIEAQN